MSPTPRPKLPKEPKTSTPPQRRPCAGRDPVRCMELSRPRRFSTSCNLEDIALKRASTQDLCANRCCVLTNKDVESEKFLQQGLDPDSWGQVCVRVLGVGLASVQPTLSDLIGCPLRMLINLPDKPVMHAGLDGGQVDAATWWRQDGLLKLSIHGTALIAPTSHAGIGVRPGVTRRKVYAHVGYRGLHADGWPHQGANQKPADPHSERAIHVRVPHCQKPGRRWLSPIITSVPFFESPARGRRGSGQRLALFARVARTASVGIHGSVVLPSCLKRRDRSFPQ
ncbi:hypothetical protein EC912_102694 [Luteibacter rhizovicinus]|uniref:Uncharacterized protein n=1 Tax=Luteibacter rhizovicinus TaxID=242606 RepID=A0A4R3YYB4_9GAMM|nr:hypothetical protein EC912_102694 [Luteibacter rhizovicinus]